MREQLNFVTHEQAKRLRDAGFDYECEYSYVEVQLIYTGGRTNSSYERSGHTARYTAPFIALALQFMREKLQVFAFVGKWFVPEIHGFGMPYIASWQGRDFESYVAAESALLDECLEIFEELRELKLVS
jgi:hypothetical protein